MVVFLYLIISNLIIIQKVIDLLKLRNQLMDTLLVYWKEDGYLFKKQASKAKLVVNGFLLLSVVATSFQNCKIKHIFYILLLSLIINGTYVYYLYLQEIYETCELNQLQHWFFFTEKTVCKPYSLTQVFEYKLFLKRLK
jgi:hypothetical protein